MVEEIEDIVEWIKKYYFLNDVWKKYDNFDKPLESDKYNINFISVCDPIMKKLNSYTDEHNNFCMKLVRNLGHHSENDEFLSYNPERCKDLNDWIYISMIKHKIPKSIITGCFEEYNFHMSGIKNIPKCFDYSYENINEDIRNIIILKIFESNMGIVKNIISGNVSFNILLQKYVCECVKIYKEMRSRYCPSSDNQYQNDEGTCNILNTLKRTYMSFIYEQPHNKYKIPSLENVEAEYLDKCVPNEGKRPVTLKAPETTSTGSSLASDEYGSPRKSPSQEVVNNENSGGSMSPTVSTALGTVAGASSVLALLYKFTPGRRWIHSGFGRKSGRISSNLYEEVPNEILFNGFQGEDMSSYNPTYNVGYGSV